MQQMTLDQHLARLPEPAMSRNTDPVGSFEAADAFLKSGKKYQHFKIIYNALKRHNGSTSLELSRHCALDRHQIARRLPEMIDPGLVKKGPSRTCRVAETKALTWWTT